MVNICLQSYCTYVHHLPLINPTFTSIRQDKYTEYEYNLKTVPIIRLRTDSEYSRARIKPRS